MSVHVHGVVAAAARRWMPSPLGPGRGPRETMVLIIIFFGGFSISWFTVGQHSLDWLVRELWSQESHVQMVRSVRRLAIR